jgi:WD40 repeat protein
MLVLDQSVGHQDAVSSLSWLPDGSGFISGGLDRKIIIWVCTSDVLRALSVIYLPQFKCQDADGKFKDSWGSAMRVTDLTVTPDLTRVVAIGIHYHPPSLPAGESSPGSRTTDASTISSGGVSGSQMSTSRKSENRMIVYDLATKQTEL